MNSDLKSPCICFVAALNCEAKPIVDRLRLRKTVDVPFVCYEGDTELGRVEVLISGVGGLAMAAAVGWLAGAYPEPNRVWLNIGTVGHGTRELGDSFIVIASQGDVGSKTYFPPMVANRSMSVDACLSVTSPTSDYPEQGGVDMEVNAFYQSAIRFGEAELVQAVKVVSDNPQNGIELLNAKRISEIMLPSTELVLRYASALLTLAAKLPAETISGGQRLRLPNLRCTHSQARIFSEKSAKLSRLLNDIEPLQATLNAQPDIRSVLNELELALRRAEPKLNAQDVS